MTTKALVVGGDGKKLAAALADFDIEITHGWTAAEQLRQGVPPDIKLVLLLVDAVPHAQFAAPLKKACDALNISFISALSRMPQLGRSLTLGGFVSKSNESLHAKRAEAPPPKPEEPAMPAVPPVPVPAPVPTASDDKAKTWSFDDLMGHLKATLKLMRDNHHVEEVFWSKEHGLNVTRKQSIDTDLD